MSKGEKTVYKKKRWIVLLAVIAVLLAGSVYLVFGEFVSRENEMPIEMETVKSDAKNLEIDENAGEQPLQETEATEPAVAIPGWGSMTIPAGVTEAAASIQNPEENEGWYYLTFELRLKETDEVVFTTGLIPPGQYCSKVTLSREFEPGEYEAVLCVQPYRISDKSPTNNAELETVLLVK